MKRHWLIITLKNKKLAKNPEVKKWLDEIRNILEAMIWQRQIDMGTYGTSTIEIENDKKTT